LWHLTGNASVEGCTFRGNSQGSFGCVSSELVVRDCVFVENDGEGRGTAMYFEDCSPAVEWCTFARDFAGDGGSGVGCFNNASPTIRFCTFYAMRGSVIRGESNSFPTLERTIIAAADSGQAVECDGTSGATLTCCDLHGNAGGDWVGCIADQYGVSGNFSADPLFCDASHDNFTLAVASPCAPEQSPGGCDLIGAWPVGCETQMEIGETTTLASGLRLGPILPSPARAPVRIACIVPAGRLPTTVVIGIHDLLGRRVRTLLLAHPAPGVQWIDWDGRGESGTVLPTGAYFCRIGTAAEAPTARRLILVR